MIMVEVEDKTAADNATMRVRRIAGGDVSFSIQEVYGGDDGSPTSAYLTITPDEWDRLKREIDRPDV